MNKKPYTVLLPTDGSLPALIATDYAVKAVKENKGRLVVLHVNEQHPVVPLEKLSMDLILMRSSQVDGIEYAKKIAGQERIPAEFIEREGSVAGEIIKLADEVGADLIVMGSSRPRGFNKFILGSVAEAVLRGTRVSTLIIKPSEEDIKKLRSNLVGVVSQKVAPITDKIDRRKLRLAFLLFAIYSVFYAAFTVAGTFGRALLSTRLMGLNVGVVGGSALIISAILIAVFYNWYATRLEASEGVG